MIAADVLEPLDALEAVDLETLTTTAALLTRVDRKYVLRADDAAVVLSKLPGDARVLEIGDERAMAYATMYFDTPDLVSYRLAAHGRRRRFKLRSRHYVASDLAFLEMKTKGARKATVKERIAHPVWAVDELTDTGRAYASAAIGALGMGSEVSDALQPTLETRYHRSTLLQASGARATVDTGLSWSDAWGTSLHLPEMVIIESKSASAPSEVDRILWRHGIRPAAISKFATGLAALRPDLPSTKWRRVIRSHFTPTAQSAR